MTDGSTFVDRESEDTVQQVRLVDPRALVYEQVNTATSGRYRITKTYVTDTRRSTVLHAGPVHRAAARRLPDVRPLRPGDRQLLPRRHRVADRRSGGRGAADQRGRHARRPGRLGRIPPHLQRLRRHQRRLDRPRGRPAARLRLRHRDGRQRPADRRAAASTPGGHHHPHAGAGLRRLGRGGRADGAGQRRGGLRRPRGRLPRRVAPVPRLAAPGPVLPLRPAAHAVQRRGDDGEGPRGQDVPGCVHRVADAAVGLRGQRRRRRRRLPLRVGP